LGWSGAVAGFDRLAGASANEMTAIVSERILDVQKSMCRAEHCMKYRSGSQPRSRCPWFCSSSVLPSVLQAFHHSQRPRTARQQPTLFYHTAAPETKLEGCPQTRQLLSSADRTTTIQEHSQVTTKQHTSKQLPCRAGLAVRAPPPSCCCCCCWCSHHAVWRAACGGVG
jgi:hypothetical protein